MMKTGYNWFVVALQRLRLVAALQQLLLSGVFLIILLHFQAMICHIEYDLKCQKAITYDSDFILLVFFRFRILETNIRLMKLVC